MTSEWAGTAWAGSETTTKAETGSFVARMQWGDYLAPQERTPQALYRRAQAAYHANPWIGSAEATVTRRVVGLPWHLEDAADEDYAAPFPAPVQQAFTLLERPSYGLPPEMRDPAMLSWRSLVAITSRHLGLCGMTHWYLDAADANGIPTNILYLNPARMWAATTKAGRTTGWVLDPADSYGNGGTPLTLDEVLTFYLDPPDFGPYGTGLYARAALKAHLTTLADQHAAYQLGTGGRLPGIVGPREGTIPQEQYEQLVREFRNVNEAPDAAKRTTVVRGPVDFQKTSVDPSELGLVELSQMNRDDIFATWGVPPATAGVPAPSGLNSGDSHKYEEAVLMQGAVHDRVRAIVETIQYGLLDRWQKLGVTIDLEIEEPEFDDDTPRYENAVRAAGLPLTVAERREIIGLAPFGDARDGEVWLPATQVVAYGPTGMAPMTPEMPMKAAVKPRDFLGLRRSVESRWMPALRKAVAAYLVDLRGDVAARVRRASEAELKRHAKNAQHWVPTDSADRLRKIVSPVVASIAETVHGRATSLLAPAKADPLTDEALVASVLRSVGIRIGDIDETTRQAVLGVVNGIIEDGLSAAEGGDRIEALGIFDEYRAELIARTETMLVYNEAALTSYADFGVSMVEAFDGDGDPECAERHGQVYTLDEASSITDHPNGTLDWIPVVGRASLAEPVKAAPPISVPLSITVHPPSVTINEAPMTYNAPDVIVAPPQVHVSAPEVTIDTTAIATATSKAIADLAPRPVTRRIERDADGLITSIVEEPA